MANSKYEKYIIKELKLPLSFSEEDKARYSKYARRILWLDERVVEGNLQFTCSWYIAPAECLTDSHVHDTDEILGFFGSDPSNPHELGGEIEFWLEDEKFTITESCMIYIPKGIKHCPQILTRVDKPIFHFGGMLGGSYSKTIVSDE